MLIIIGEDLGKAHKATVNGAQSHRCPIIRVPR